jgi:hypothetical protein
MIHKALTGGDDPLLSMEGRAWHHITCSIVDHHFGSLAQNPTQNMDNSAVNC